MSVIIIVYRIQIALELERRAEIQRKKRNAVHRLEAAAAAEKKAMHSYRFPEDQANDNLEAGQLSSWLVLGLTVPAVNIFIDQHIAGLLKKDAKYIYNQVCVILGNHSRISMTN